MANPEHVRIVRAGKKAVEEYWGGPPTRRGTRALKPPCRRPGLDLAGAHLDGLILREVCLHRVDLRGASLENADLSWCDLRNADFTGARVGVTRLAATNLKCANFQNADLGYSDLTGAYMPRANLCGARLVCARVVFADLRRADMTRADISLAQFASTNLRRAILNGVIMEDTGTDGWIIGDVACTHFFMSVSPNGPRLRLIRVPSRGELPFGEFQDRFMSRPTIQFIFRHGMGAFGPAALATAIDKANEKHPAAHLRLLDITARGGVPRAIIEVAEEVPKRRALALVQMYYEQQSRHLLSEIQILNRDKQSLLAILSQKMLLPPIESPAPATQGPGIDSEDKWITGSEAAKILVVHRGTVWRWANEERIRDNGKARSQRRVSKASVLLLKEKLEEETLRGDIEDIRTDAHTLPDRH